jgi:hypothetical protein
MRKIVITIFIVVVIGCYLIYSKVLTNINLKYSKNKLRPYGSVGFNGDLNNISIYINLHKILNEKQDNVKKLFNLYYNLIHELEHDKTFDKTKDEQYYDFEQLMVLLEYLSYAQKLNIDISNGKINLIAKFSIKRLMDMNYSFSTTEMKSRLVAYKETLEMFLPYLKEEDIKTYKQIIESSSFLNNNTEIMYDETKRPVNKFWTILILSQILISKNKETIQKFGILKNLYNDDGSIKSLYELYKSINIENKEMYDKLIINLFLTVNADLKSYFIEDESKKYDEDFKRYMEDLINKYNKKAVYYFDNIELGKVFINDNRKLKDNLRMLKQNEALLNNDLAKRYNLKLNSGILLDYTLRKTF